MRTRFYYTLRDLTQYETNKASEAKTNANTLSDILQIYDDELVDVGTVTMQKELFQNYIYPKFKEHALCYLDLGHGNWDCPERPDIDDEECDDMVQELIGRMYSWLVSSTEKYEKLIGLYNDNKAHLLDNIKAITKFSDTPMDGGSFLDDNHVTTATQSETQLGTIMTRLDEVNNKLRNMYEMWANEFKKFIIYV